MCSASYFLNILQNFYSTKLQQRRVTEDRYERSNQALSSHFIKPHGVEAGIFSLAMLKRKLRMPSSVKHQKLTSELCFLDKREDANWLQPLCAELHSHFAQPLCAATLRSHFAQPLCAATLRSHFAQPLFAATLRRKAAEFTAD
jgi:hypothetical protein